MDLTYVLAFCNAGVSLAVVWSCLCRLGASSALTVRRAVRFKYVALLMGAMANAGSPFVGEWPGKATLLFASCVLLTLLVEMNRWRHGAPPDVRTDLGELGLPELERFERDTR